MNTTMVYTLKGVEVEVLTVELRTRKSLVEAVLKGKNYGLIAIVPTQLLPRSTQ